MPYDFRTWIAIEGMVALAPATTARIPARITPSRSEREPIMKPGTSTKRTTGMLKVLQRSTKWVCLSAESAVMAPA